MKTSTLAAIILSLVILLFLSLIFIRPLSQSLKLYKLTTIYAQNYKDKNFLEVQKNMSFSQVHEIMGDPLEKYDWGDKKVWSYSRTDSGWNDFIGWESVRVFFKDGIVTDIAKIVF